MKAWNKSAEYSMAKTALLILEYLLAAQVNITLTPLMSNSMTSVVEYKFCVYKIRIVFA